MRNVFLVRGLLVLLLCLTARPATAVILYLKDQDQPIRGYYVRENEHAVVLLELLPNGSTAERTVPRAQIDDMIRSVSEERLAALSPEKPDAYREYAEELAEKRKDPDAQVAGLRLFQMAAVLEPQRLGRSCLLGMVPLARDTAELRRFRAMAYLLDPDHDPALLSVSERAATRSSDLDEKQAEFLLKSLRALRQGKRKEALMQARRCKLKERLPLLTDTITYEEFDKACRPRAHIARAGVSRAQRAVEAGRSRGVTRRACLAPRAAPKEKSPARSVRETTNPIPSRPPCSNGSWRWSWRGCRARSKRRTSRLRRVPRGREPCSSPSPRPPGN